MSTPTYVPPSISPAGLTVSNYAAILNDNLNIFLNIYGTNQYVAPDSAIYQFLSAISLKQADTNLALSLAYNQSSPQTAVGAGLDRQVKMNGLARLPFTYSTALLTLTFTAAATVTNGFAQDQQGNLWALPTTVSLASAGTISVQATCTTPGAVVAESGTINIINTPQANWSLVTNAAAAITGQPVESDSALRARQSISVALVATTPIASTIAAILATPGVARVAPGYPTPGGPGSSINNPTGGVDSWGNPAHSISLVVQCSDTVSVAQAIYNKKTLGCFTNGTTTVPVTDPVTGVVENISFYQPTALPIFLLVMLTGYGAAPTSTVLAAVQAALVNYLNALAIGETVSLGALYYEAMAINASLQAPAFGVQSILTGTQTAATTATFTASSLTIVVASAVGIVSGQLVVGAGIVPGTTVNGAPAGTTVTLSIATTAIGTASPVAFSTLSAADVVMTNYYYAASASAVDVAVVTV